MTTQAGTTHEHHRRAVRFFWGLLIGATVVSLVGNVTHALLPLIPHVVVQIGAAVVPPVAMLAAVHGIALAVRAGASGRVYWWAVSAISAIGICAFVVSFVTLRNLMETTGYGATTACAFPAIIDTTVAVATLMLVALGDRPARRIRPAKVTSGADSPSVSGSQPRRIRGANAEVSRSMVSTTAVPISASTQSHRGHVERGSVQAEALQADTEFASELIASGATTQPVETVVSVLSSHRSGASINATAKASGINYRTAQRIVAAAGERGRRQLAVVG